MSEAPKRTPDAWQYRVFHRDHGDTGWGIWHACNNAEAEYYAIRPDTEVRELFAAPTSAAGATNPNELTSSPEPAPALRAADDLHQQILNLPCEVPGDEKTLNPVDESWVDGFKNGHKAARHAAAELASGLLPVAREGLSDEQLARIEVALEAGAIWAKHSEAHPRINSVLAEVRAYRQSVTVPPASGDAPGEANG